MKSKKAISPSAGSEAKIVRLQRQMAVARKQAEKLRTAAHRAKAELKRMRKFFKQAKRAAKTAKKKTKAWAKMLRAAQEVVSAAKLKEKDANPAFTPKVKPAARRRRIKAKRPVPLGITSTALSLGEQYSSGATLGAAAKYPPTIPATAPSSVETEVSVPPPGP